jgi:pectate lyase
MFKTLLAVFVVLSVWIPKFCNADAITAGSRVVVVTSLADSGAGTLRKALEAKLPQVIVFSVSGYIELKSDLVISTEGTIIAGETAPGSGVVLRGASVKVRASNVKLRHIAVYAGASDDEKTAENRDAISIYGPSDATKPIGDVVLSHVTAAWGVDENIGIQGKVDGVRIENSLIFQGLMDGGHPKGIHSMNLLLGSPVGRVEILGNIFASSNQRSPRLTNGNRVSLINNYVFGWGLLATHIDRSVEILAPGTIEVIGNVYVPRFQASCERFAIHISKDFFESQPATSVYLQDNLLLEEESDCQLYDKEMFAGSLSSKRILDIKRWNTLEAKNLGAMIFDIAGPRPAKRNALDKRAVYLVAHKEMQLIDNESEAGGFPEIEEENREIHPPVLEADSVAELDKLKSWLCEFESEVGGRSSFCS